MNRSTSPRRPDNLDNRRTGEGAKNEALIGISSKGKQNKGWGHRTRTGHITDQERESGKATRQKKIHRWGPNIEKKKRGGKKRKNFGADQTRVLRGCSARRKEKN